jgi:quinol monooxygenase YgiN
MGALRLTVLLEPLPGARSALDDLIHRLIARSRGDGPGTLVYCYYAHPKSDRMFVHEHYADAEAFLAHLTNVADLATKLGGCARVVRVEAAGSFSEQIRTMLSGNFDEAALAAGACLFYDEFVEA